MQKFLSIRSKTLVEKLITIIGGFGLAYFWTMIISFIFDSISMADSFNQMSQQFNLIEMFVLGVIFAPIWEELVFRRALVGITKKLHIDYTLPILIGSSCLFGWLHGSVINIYFQGVGGFIIGVVYIRNGYCYWSAVTLHAIWNLVCFLTFIAQ